MNPRVLELIKNPELFQKQDLEILNSEIKKHPYIQNIRALYLYGIYTHQPENYPKELSTTAAYTTDKKILYQFINKKEIAEKATISENPMKAEPLGQEITDEITEVSAPSEKSNAVFPIPIEAPKPVYVDGVLNRILFEGEENFLENESVKIDIESTRESGKIVTQTIKKEEKAEEEILKTEEEILPKEEKIQEVIVENTENIATEAKEETNADVSFHSMEEFLPEVKIVSTNREAVVYEAPKPTLSKHEEEMQRLIAEVEAKMKNSKKEKLKTEDPPISNAEVNFAETQDFIQTELKEKTAEEEIIETKNEAIAEIPEQVEFEVKNIKSTDSHKFETETSTSGHIIEEKPWKPMSFISNTPDSLINNKSAEKPKTTENPSKRTPVESSVIPVEKSEERPVFNVSFFSQNVLPIQDQQKIEVPQNISKETTLETSDASESNIPNFINTWQKWLKIGQNEGETSENAAISKEKLIEEFIVKEPKISKLKEDSDFIVKEKGDNIWHLMTETLANLYLEQRLYSKAIKAFEILVEKNPDKKKYFSEKIDQIKELRQNK